MALTIDATVGGSAANSFVTVAEMTAYCEGRLNASVWVASATQEPALVEAARELSALEWQGITVTDTQALTWPRQYVLNVDSALGLYYATSVIPKRVKDAACELALQFLKAGTTDVASAPTTDGILEKTVDVLTTKYADSRAQKAGLQRYPSVWRTFKPLLASPTNHTFSIVRG